MAAHHLQKIKFLLFLLFVSGALFAQVPQTIGSPKNEVKARGVFSIDSLLLLPKVATQIPSTAGAVRLNDTTVEVFINGNWKSIAADVKGVASVARQTGFPTVAAMMAAGDNFKRSQGIYQTFTLGFADSSDGGGTTYARVLSVPYVDSIYYFPGGTEYWARTNQTGSIRAKEAGVKSDGTNQAYLLNKLANHTRVTEVIIDDTITVNSKVDFKGKKLTIRDGGYLKGTDTVANVFVEAAPNANIFGLEVQNLLNGDFPATWFGATANAIYNNPTAGTDNTPKLLLAIRAKSSSSTYQPTGFKGKVRLPAGPTDYGYRFASTIPITQGVEIYGDGIQSTVLFFDPGVKGFW
ncbi:MAG: hypothetical protein EOP49_40800, partial [Sphingobacteriales bacterium]